MLIEKTPAKCPRLWPTLRSGAVLALLLPLVAAPLAAKKPSKQADIDCAAGDSINRALALHLDADLVVNIRGICTEDVVVQRDDVALRGTDPAIDGIRAATLDDPYGAALFIRGGRMVTVENLQLTGAKHAGLLVEDVRRSLILRNLQIVGNREVGLIASNSLVVGFGLEISGNGLAGAGVSETAYLRCDDCRIVDNPGVGQGFGILASASALVTLSRGSIAGQFPLSVRFNSVATLNGTSVTGAVALDATGGANITAKGSTIDGTIRVHENSQLELRNSQQVFNPVAGGNIVSGASQMTAVAGTTLIGETAFDEFSNGMFNRASLETLACYTGSDAICSGGVSLASSTCTSCP